MKRGILTTITSRCSGTVCCRRRIEASLHCSTICSRSECWKKHSLSWSEKWASRLTQKFVQFPCAVCKGWALDTSSVQHGDEQIRHGHLIAEPQIATVFQSHLGSTRQYQRIVIVIVGDTVAAAIEDQRVVEERSILLLSRRRSRRDARPLAAMHRSEMNVTNKSCFWKILAGID